MVLLGTLVAARLAHVMESISTREVRQTARVMHSAGNSEHAVSIFKELAQIVRSFSSTFLALYVPIS